MSNISTQRVSPPDSDPAGMVFFGIPVRARSARGWTRIVGNFNRTLASLYNQTSPNFRILVGCHDIPYLRFPTDDRLEFIPADTPPPDLATDAGGDLADRAHKLRRIAERLHEIGGGWFMALEPEDLVSSRLVAFLLGNPDAHGFIARTGYLLDPKSRKAAPVPHRSIFKQSFDRLCRSTAVIRFDQRDFDSGPSGRSRFERCLEADHRVVADDERPLSPLPFPAIAHVVDEDVDSLAHGPDAALHAPSLRKAIRRHALWHDGRLRHEFALDHPAWDSDLPAKGPAIRSEPGFRIGFVGCGAMKAGTTALAHHLGRHPAVGMGIKKELHYFDSDRNFRPEGPDYDHYHNQFPRRTSARIYGEVTPTYMYFPKTVERIYLYNPKIKLIAVLRNPIERAFSHWNWTVRRNLETLSFSEALECELERHRASAPDRSRSFGYVDRGFYAEQIRRIWRMFPPEQTLFVKSDDLKHDPEKTMNVIFRFLDVEPISVPRDVIGNEGKYVGAPSEREYAFLLHVFENEIRALERLLGWDCASWLDRVSPSNTRKFVGPAPTVADPRDQAKAVDVVTTL